MDHQLCGCRSRPACPFAAVPIISFILRSLEYTTNYIILILTGNKKLEVGEIGRKLFTRFLPTPTLPSCVYSGVYLFYPFDLKKSCYFWWFSISIFVFHFRPVVTEGWAFFTSGSREPRSNCLMEEVQD